MIAKSFLIGLAIFGAGIGTAQATHVGNKAHAPVAGIELGERLNKPATPIDVAAAPQPEPVSADGAVPSERPERKVRVVYPLPR